MLAVGTGVGSVWQTRGEEWTHESLRQCGLTNLLHLLFTKHQNFPSLYLVMIIALI